VCGASWDALRCVRHLHRAGTGPVVDLCPSGAADGGQVEYPTMARIVPLGWVGNWWHPRSIFSMKSHLSPLLHCCRHLTVLLIRPCWLVGTLGFCALSGQVDTQMQAPKYECGDLWSEPYPKPLIVILWVWPFNGMCCALWKCCLDNSLLQCLVKPPPGRDPQDSLKSGYCCYCFRFIYKAW